MDSDILPGVDGRQTCGDCNRQELKETGLGDARMARARCVTKQGSKRAPLGLRRSISRMRDGLICWVPKPLVGLGR